MGELTFTLSDKTTIVVAANSTTGSATVIAPDNVYVGTNSAVVNSIATVGGADDGKFEKLTLDQQHCRCSCKADYPGLAGRLITVLTLSLSARMSQWLLP
ncbi:immunoglobulin-like domain-containing protein [Pseudomonas putida]|uniref:immunoglobulin-like domain-containing protein n=1 Tax=Pseudomonas putida TaxID=303 RepID=UPI0003158941|nr:immunoglobulin-like domain-containing protein [Pseudomonas putida]